MKLSEVLDSINDTSIKFKTSTPYICGGVVRDKLLNRINKINDLDITTGDKTIHLLGQEFYNSIYKKYNVTSETAKDNHFTISMGNLKIDFSSNFIYPNINNLLGPGNYNSLELETYSRDYTCNSLLSDLKLSKILDITKRGERDINSKIIDTCLSPEHTLSVQPNRAFRAVYLAVKLGFNISPRVIKWLKSNSIIIQGCKFSYLDEKIAFLCSIDKNRTNDLLTECNMKGFIPQEILLRNNL